MAELYLRRVRALVAFGFPYQVFLNRDRQRVLAAMAKLQGSDRTAPIGDVTLKNGQGVRLPIPPEGLRVFGALCLETSEVASEELFVPADEGDVYVDLITVANYNRRMGLKLVRRPAETEKN